MNDSPDRKRVQKAAKSRLHASLRLVVAPDVALGPGKAELLERIRDAGSISAAARAMGMSYKRAWQMIESMNHSFRSPLVETAKGGANGGGAQLTPTGEQLVSLYRRMEEKAAAAIKKEMAALHRLADPCRKPERS